MATPKFLGPDGILREEFNFSTTLAFRFFSGTTDADTVDMQVSVRGDPFVSDADLISFEGTTFSIPNPTVYPDGLPLDAGLNEIRVRAVLTNGSVTPEAVIRARLVQESDLGMIVLPPTGISAERKSGLVVVTVEGLDDSHILGYNFYASTQEGGGIAGYSKINSALVSSGVTAEEETSLSSLDTDIIVAVGGDLLPLADPQYLNILGTQQDREGVVLTTDFNESLEIPETARKLRFAATINTVRNVTSYSFTHSRTATLQSVYPAIPNSSFGTIAETDPLYYVASAVYYDDVAGVETESSYSPEVTGAPIVVTSAVGAFPTVNRTQIVQDMSLSVFRSNPGLSIEPGSVLRDTVMDPASVEMARVRFVIDFMHRAQSPASLLAIDDPNRTGASVPVSASAYKLDLKKAFYLTADADVQALIDDSFDILGNRYGLTRDPGNYARGEVTFYTKSRPTRSKTFPVGTLVSSGVQFRTTTTAQVTLSNVASIYSASTGRYSVRASIKATDRGAAGNLTEGQIRKIVTAGYEDFSVTNEGRISGGTERESNLRFAERIGTALAMISGDTEWAYRQTAIGVSSVEEVKVISAGDANMLRDFDGAIHRGGKVDVWVRGSQTASVTDDFAFSYEIAKGMAFAVVGDPQNLTFIALDSNLSVNNPIIEVLDIPAWGYEFVNANTGVAMNLTGVVIQDYRTIVLSSTYNDPVTYYLTDVFHGSYRYRTSDRFVFPRQPVESIESLTGTVTGVVNSSAYALYRAASPLQLGRSEWAGDYLKVTDTQATGITIPSGTPITVASEEHVILAGYTEYLFEIGANVLTLEVWDSSHTTMYISPYADSVNNDYTVIMGTDTSPVGVRLTTGSAIVSGSSVLFDYSHDERFTVRYSLDSMTRETQTALDQNRNLHADVLAKKAVPIPVDLGMTVILQQNTDLTPDKADTAIRTALYNYENRLRVGQRLRPSDAIGVVEKITGVSHVLVPLTKLVLTEGALVLREPLTVATVADVFKVPSWSTSTVDVYLLRSELAAATTDRGGPSNEYRSVYQNDNELDLQEMNPNLQSIPLKRKAGNAYIIGNGGMTIPGYTGDTANRVLVSVPMGDTPLNYSYAVTYIASEGTGMKSEIRPGPLGYVVFQNIELVFDEEVPE